MATNDKAEVDRSSERPRPEEQDLHGRAGHEQGADPARVLSGRRPGPREELPRPGQDRLLRRHHLPSRHRRLHDPGRLSRRAPAPATPATRSRPSSTRRRTSPASCRWPGPTIPNSAGTQFFICLEHAQLLDNKYTAFGKVTDEESMATVKAIGKVKTGRRQAGREGGDQEGDGHGAGEVSRASS